MRYGKSMKVANFIGQLARKVYAFSRCQIGYLSMGTRYTPLMLSSVLRLFFILFPGGIQNALTTWMWIFMVDESWINSTEPMVIALVDFSCFITQHIYIYIYTGAQSEPIGLLPDVCVFGYLCHHKGALQRRSLVPQSVSLKTARSTPPRCAQFLMVYLDKVFSSTQAW